MQLYRPPVFKTPEEKKEHEEGVKKLRQDTIDEYGSFQGFLDSVANNVTKDKKKKEEKN